MVDVADSVTIRGYLRNFNRVPEGIVRRTKYTSPVFSVSINNYLWEDALKFYADVDSLGRFTLKFPLYSAKLTYMDWGRLSRNLVLEPGDELFIYADLLDFILKAEKDYWDFMAEPKSILFMGDNARLNNELANCFNSGYHFHCSAHDKENKKLSDMDFLAKGDSINKRFHQAIDTVFANYPTLSKKFKYIQRNDADYEWAFSLLQRSFQLIDENRKLEKGYLEYVEDKFPLNDKLARDINIFREAGSFFTDFTWYQAYKGSALSVGLTWEEFLGEVPEEALEMEKDTGNIKTLKAMLALRDEYLTFKNDSLTVKSWSEKNTEFFKGLSEIESYQDAQDRLFLKKRLKRKVEAVYEVVLNQKLREFYLTKELLQGLNSTMVPLEEDIKVELKERITDKGLWALVEDVNNYYIKNQDKKISYTASLVSTDHLKDARDVEALFAKIMTPHRGKVVYVDFWGTWCGPCMAEMPHVKKLKEYFKGKDVVFMYFANRTSDQSWKNALKKFGLTGEISVHYNLPTEQQEMLERKFGVNSFPSYFIFNKEGEMVNNSAPRPSNKASAIEAIEKYLE